MWWPGPTSATWHEAHNSPGETSTGTRWAFAEGELGGPRNIETYVLIANTSPFAGTARVTVMFEDGSAPIARDFPLNPSSRSNVVPAARLPGDRRKEVRDGDREHRRHAGADRRRAGDVLGRQRRALGCRHQRAGDEAAMTSGAVRVAYNPRTMSLRFSAIAAVCLLAGGAVLSFASSARAQPASTDEQAVVAVVQRLFDAMAACDAAGARAITMPEGRLYRMVIGADPAVQSSTFEEFNAGLGRCGRRMLERMWTPQVRVHKGIASLWAPYDFWLDGAFSHCGIDSFELVKTPDGWKLTGGTYTVERDGCAPSPLGVPSFTAKTP